MHPVLFEIPLPALQLPLFGTLLVVAGLGFLLALVGWRWQAKDLLVIGSALAVGCLPAAFAFRGGMLPLDSLPIYSYGALLCLSIVVGWYLTLHLAERDGMRRELMANCYFVTAITAVVGARLLYVITNPSDFSSLAELLALRRGGLVAYGGFLGGFAGSLWFLRRRGLAMLPWADAAVPSLALGLSLTRFGCYMFGCDFGRPLSEAAPAWLRWIGTFPKWQPELLSNASGSPAWVQHVSLGWIEPVTESSLPVHPTQLYAALAGLGLFALVMWVRRHRRFSGEAFLAFIVAYGFIRFALEIVRGDPERGAYGPEAPAIVLLPLAASVFSAVIALGPARAIAQPRKRWSVWALCAALPLLLALVLSVHPASFAQLQLSTSQWLGLLSSVAAGWFWWKLLKSPPRSPGEALPDTAESVPQERSAAS